MGGLDVKKVVNGDEGWRLLSCNWLHGGVAHLLVNMLTLLFIGIRMEREFGFSKLLLLSLCLFLIFFSVLTFFICCCQ